MDVAAAVDEEAAADVEAAAVLADVPDVSGNTHGDDKGDDNDDKNGEDDGYGNDPCPHVDAEVNADAKVAGPEGRRQSTNTDRWQ